MTPQAALLDHATGAFGIPCLTSLGTVQNFLLGRGWSFLGVTIKFLVPPLRVTVKNGYPPPGARTFSGQQRAGANRVKGASMAAGELPKRDILLCSVSIFVCVQNGYPPRSLRKILVPPSETLLETGTLPAKGPPPIREILNSP